MNKQNRTPAGAPTGGQFAASDRSEASIDLAAPSVLDVSAYADPSTDADFTGSGWNDYRPVRAVTVLGDIYDGDLLAHQSRQFNARNLMRVTRIDRTRGIVYGHFADPADPSRKRMADDQEFAIWASEFGTTTDLFTTEAEGYDEGPSCSICDGLGHGYPGGPPCPLEVNEQQRWETDEDERRAAMFAEPDFPF